MKKNKRQNIPLDQFQINFIQAMNKWFILACGDFEEQAFNAMTISWGSIGIVWGKPFVQVFVRPSRYTFEFMEKNETFTLSAFPPEYEPALDLIGSKSGRRWNKIKESGLMPIESSIVASPGFDEAELIIECRKIYYNDLIPENFLDEEVQSLYTNDYHRLYFGEIVAISGIKKYIKAPEEIKKA